VHTCLTHYYLLSGEDQPECAHCKCPLTVKHLLLECAAFNNIRLNFTVSAMKELFDTVDMRHIINFIKDISIFIIVFNLLVSFQLQSFDITNFF